jgi:TonB family protein
MLRASTFIAATTIAFLVTPLLSQEGPQQRMEKIVSTTSSLDQEKVGPYHLKLSFQIYDLDGKPTEKGELEQYWTPHHTDLTIQSPSYSYPHAGATANDSLRQRFLINNLLAQVTHPIPPLEKFSESRDLKETPFKYGNAHLSCLYFNLPERFAEQQSAMDRWALCTEPGQDILRISSVNDEPMVLRSAIGIFRDVMVGTSTMIIYSGRPAISGHIETLETYHPPADVADSAAENDSPVTLSGKVLTGHAVQQPRPIYPESAKSAHISGSVLLSATISKDGSVKELSVIASPDKSLSDSALAAVRGWRYKPYLLDGRPMEVETVITVNYNFN